MKNWTIPAAALLLIVAAGFQHRQQNRGEAQDAAILEAAASTLDERIPLRIGDWTGVELPIEPRALEVAEIAGYVSRTYTHKLTGEWARMVIVCGPPGPISVHTPDVCFPGNGSEMVTEPKRITLEMPDGQTAEFWWADFRQGAGAHAPLRRTFWSWKAQSPWKVVDHPRIEFASSPFLYKLYLEIPVIPQEIASIDQPETEFLKALLREFGQAESGQSPGNAEN